MCFFFGGDISSSVDVNFFVYNDDDLIANVLAHFSDGRLRGYDVLSSPTPTANAEIRPVTTPEPATAALGLLGLMGLMTCRRRTA